MDEKVRKVKIVVVKHQNCNGKFVFKVPDQIDLSVGEYILCNTIRKLGEVGECTTPSFEINERQLREFYGVGIANLAPVIGRLKPRMFVYPSEGE